MKNGSILIIILFSISALVGCSSQGDDEADGPPSDPLEQMLIAFNGSPSKVEIQEAMDNALNATETPISEENYSRAGSVLVEFRNEYGINEMDILECVPTATTDPRLPELSFPNVAAVCVTDMASGNS